MLLQLQKHHTHEPYGVVVVHEGGEIVRNPLQHSQRDEPFPAVHVDIHHLQQHEGADGLTGWVVVCGGEVL